MKLDRMNWIGKSKRCYLSPNVIDIEVASATKKSHRIRTPFIPVVVAAAIYILQIFFCKCFFMYIICISLCSMLLICNNNSEVMSENWMVHEKKIYFRVNQELIKLNKWNPLDSKEKSNQKYLIILSTVYFQQSQFPWPSIKCQHFPIFNICLPILFCCLFCIVWTLMIIICQSVDLVN